MICGIMQPYLFPYIGYYQLVNLSDVFIIYDDVTFIKQSYINRNSILINEESYRFTLPVVGASSFKLINQLEYSDSRKLLKTIQQTYVRAPYFSDVFEIIKEVLMSEDRSVSIINFMSIIKVFEYLGIEKKILLSSQINYNREDSREDRLISIAKKFGCSKYVNSPGGKKLYNKDYFLERGIKLSFINSKIISYKQLSENFTPYLSIIDILMFCDKSKIKDMLSLYELE